MEVNKHYFNDSETGYEITIYKDEYEQLQNIILRAEKTICRFLDIEDSILSKIQKIQISGGYKLLLHLDDMYELCQILLRAFYKLDYENIDNEIRNARFGYNFETIAKALSEEIDESIVEDPISD